MGGESLISDLEESEGFWSDFANEDHEQQDREANEESIYNMLLAPATHCLLTRLARERSGRE